MKRGQVTLGITTEQSLRTFDASIITRPFDDVTIYKTYSGMVIGLWQQGSITEIWYVGEMVEALTQRAIDDDHDASCEAAAAECCNTQPNPDGDPATPDLPKPTPNMDSCAAVTSGACPNQEDQACGCLSNACLYCPHPAPDPPDPPDPDWEPPCDAETQALSTQACNLHVERCGPPPPPMVPVWVQDILDLLHEILDRLQDIIDNLPMN